MVSVARAVSPPTKSFALGSRTSYIGGMRDTDQVARMPLSVRRQAVTGLALAFAIVFGWACLHVYAMFFFELRWATIPLALAIVLIQCWLSVGLFIVSHDAMHGSLVPRGGRINDIVGGFLLFIYAGFSWRRMRDAHFAHHRAPGSADDPDFSADHPSHFWPWYAEFLKRYFGWQSVVFVFTVVLTYWLAFGVPVEKIVLLYGVPAIASSMQLFYFGTFRPHRHRDDRFADHHNARSDSFGTMASLATCFHFGYHHEHHLAPHVPWWQLPAARRSASSDQQVTA